MSSAALLFIIIFSVLMAIPCFGVAWLGVRYINKLGNYPSKTPQIQVDIVIKLVFLEMVSFTLILLFFKVLSVD
ncbi:MAG: hypothetical protein WC552_04960 [Candidatus Omnitrophota bacterium]